MIQSMTGFASGTGTAPPFNWSWELRSVNAKGLDLRLRVPDWIEGLEAALRARLSRAMGRGSVTLSLRVQRDETAGDLAVNEAVLASVLTAMARIEEQAMDVGLSLAPATPADILSVRGVLEQTSPEQSTAALLEALLAGFDPVLATFLDMRASEGQALSAVLARQVGEIGDLVEAAATTATARKPEMAAALRTSLARVLDNTDGADPQRVAQELALIAVKTDVTEEIDRLRAHVAAARTLLHECTPVGRKLDFLMQEFNREANTLCSKSQSAALTRIGLDLKTVIDQMREQVQNVE
ncbi:TIGR00255 family protein [Thalassovita taeanensis]|uniref:TIGR00255 family protein n=2 Tax=Thalassovita taeanensis TaxID=657014 RepID=A0A1H8Z367_9RHOB|nr:TIGR00255 family protein [Thalassovita taeanensis]